MKIKTFKYKYIYLIYCDNMNKVKVELDEDVVNALIQRKKVGDTYTDVVRELLKGAENGRA